MSGDPARSPRRLKIKTTRDAIDVERFAGEMKAWDDPTFHGFEVHFWQGNASTSDEFLFMSAFSSNQQFGGYQKAC
jgi:hypothetical protein